MDEPGRCYTCGTILHPTMYKSYSDALDQGLSTRECLTKVKGLNPDCFACNRMMLSHIPLVENEFYLKAYPRPTSFSEPLTEFFETNKKTKKKKNAH